MPLASSGSVLALKEKGLRLVASSVHLALNRLPFRSSIGPERKGIETLTIRIARLVRGSALALKEKGLRPQPTERVMMLRSELALKEKGLRLDEFLSAAVIVFSIGPEGKGIETSVTDSVVPMVGSALALKEKGLRPSVC